MLHPRKLMIQAFIAELKEAYQQLYGSSEPAIRETLIQASQLALERIANCNALYHNVEHTMMVVSAGQAILRGKQMREGDITPKDWLLYILALLFHDIGYVRGICRQDHDPCYATGIAESTVTLNNGCTDAALAPYHVDRGKLFVHERIANKMLADADADHIAFYIEITRFPIPPDGPNAAEHEFLGLVRAADFIGQLGDPDYLTKIPALFCEFEETGMNAQNGHFSPGDMRNYYAQFYWERIHPHIQDALHYLRLTQEGKQWIASLYSNVFTVEHGVP